MRTTKKIYLVAASLILMAYAIPAEAQYDSLKAGEKVRVLAPSIHINSIVGKVTDVSSTGILINTKGSSLTIPFSSINRLDVSKGRKRNIGKGALIGLGTGALAGGLTGAVTYKECNEEGWAACIWQPESRGAAFLFGAVVGGVTGTVLGTIVGVFTKSDKWERVPVKVTTGLLPSRTEKLSLNPTISLKLSLNRNH